MILFLLILGAIIGLPVAAVLYSLLLAVARIEEEHDKERDNI